MQSLGLALVASGEASFPECLRAALGLAGGLQAPPGALRAALLRGRPGPCWDVARSELGGLEGARGLLVRERVTPRRFARSTCLVRLRRCRLGGFSDLRGGKSAPCGGAWVCGGAVSEGSVASMRGSGSRAPAAGRPTLRRARVCLIGFAEGEMKPCITSRWCWRDWEASAARLKLSLGALSVYPLMRKSAGCCGL